MNSEQRILHAVLRRNLESFIHRSFQTLVPGQEFVRNWHIDAMAYALDQVYRGQIKRLIITLPRAA